MAWVRVPSVNVNTVIYMYYGNAQITAATQTPAVVFDTDYVGVWHLGETGSGTLNEYRDSAPSPITVSGGQGVAAAVPARVSGKIGFAQHFSNGDGPTTSSTPGGRHDEHHGNQITLQAWVRHNIVVNTAHGTPPAANTAYGILTHKGYADGYSLWLYGANDSTCPGSEHANGPASFSTSPVARSRSERTWRQAPSAGTWHHVVGTYDGATMTVYADGAAVTTLAKTGNIAPSSAEQDMWIGQGDQPENVAWSGEFEGDIDEVRISRVTRSANWILTEYRNQGAPAVFYALGGESTVGGPWALTPITVNYRSIGTAGQLRHRNAQRHERVGDRSPARALPGAPPIAAAATASRSTRPDYTILAVDSDTQIRLTIAVHRRHRGRQVYTIARKFNAPQAWENCISFPRLPWCHERDLVADNRSEVGIVYYDGPVRPGRLLRSTGPRPTPPTPSPSQLTPATGIPGRAARARPGRPSSTPARARSSGSPTTT